MGMGAVRPPFLRTSSTRLLMPHWFQFFTGFGMSLPRTCATDIIDHCLRHAKCISCSPF